jgi:phosphoribosyl-AMP cyclohydrolase
MAASSDIEEGATFAPKFGSDGLITCVAIDAHSSDVLMVAHMNREALDRTLVEGRVWYFSRSRQTLWLKGETSGQIQSLVEMRVDCDQDCLVVKVKVGGDGGACHTGRSTCFYRRVVNGPQGPVLTFVEP